MLRKIRRIAKGVVTDCFNALFNPPLGYVLMLHRLGTAEPDRLEVIEELKVSEERLQRFVDATRKQYDFVSLDELYNRLIGVSSSRRPFICITFDDGFKDNFTIGLPFFEKNHIPFSIFITTDFINRKPAFNYPFLLERMIQANNSMKVNGQLYECQNRTQKNHTFQQLKELVLDLPYDSFEASFNGLFKDYLKPEFFEDLMMTWDEVRALAESPFCTIGSHTVNHCRLVSLTPTQLEYELSTSKEVIEAQIGREVKFASYPFGWTSDVNEFVCQYAQKVGYQMGFVSHGGAIRKKDKNMYNVRRIMLVDNE